MAEFWWKNAKEGRGIHWKSWDKLCKSKEVGGLDFKELEDFNLALLGKQVRRILTKGQSLIAKVHKARYFQHSSILNAKLGSSPSYAWRSLHAAQKLMKLGCIEIIGNGEETNMVRSLDRRQAGETIVIINIDVLSTSQYCLEKQVC